MKRQRIVWLVLFIAAFVATGCAKANTNSAATGGAASGGAQATLSPAMKLALGTFRLEETDQAITAEQAATLLPLWKAYRALSQSDTAVTLEMDALVKQIEGALTASQRGSIDGMGLTYADLPAVMEQRGVELGAGAGAGAARGNLTSEQIATLQARRAQGGGFSPGAGGGPGGGPGGMMIFEGAAPGGMAAAPGAAAGAASSGSSAQQGALAARAIASVPTALLDALVSLLSERAGVAQ